MDGVRDIGLAPPDRRDLAEVEIDAGADQAIPREFDRERQAHIAEADDPDARAAGVNAFEQLFSVR
jgi:hypothetical protein